MDTFLKSGIQLEQQHSLPQGAMPPIIFISSRMPILRSYILSLNADDSSFTSSLKSTLPSAVK